MPLRSRMSSIMNRIEPEHLELFGLEFRKIAEIAEYDFVYSLSSTNIDQSAPNLVKMYVIISSQMCLIIDLIRRELSELSGLQLENLPYLTLFTLWHLQISINQYQPGHNIYAHQVSYEFDYGTNQTRTSGVICP